MVVRVRLAALVLCGLVEVGLAQQATTRPVGDAIVVVGGSDLCLAHDALTGEVERWLGKHDIDVPITIEVSGRGGTAALRIRRDGESAVHKTFEVLPIECRARRRAVSLAIALAIDQTVLDHAMHDPAGAETEAVPALEPAPEPKAADAPAPGPLASLATAAPTRSGRPSLQVGVSYLAGVLPRPAFGASAACSVRISDRVSTRVGVLATQPVDVELDPGTVTSQLVAVRLDGCVHQPLGALAGSGCAGIAAGVVAARGRELDEPLAIRPAWAAGHFRIATRYPASGRIGVQLALDGVVNLLRPRIEVMDTDGDDDDGRTFPAIGAGASLELVMDLR